MLCTGAVNDYFWKAQKYFIVILFILNPLSICKTIDIVTVDFKNCQIYIAPEIVEIREGFTVFKIK